MKIKKFITINWANLENIEYKLDDLVFLTGQTGVGKSTFLDAIQTGLTAAHNNIVNYNAGQDESERKSKHKEYRKLEGYVLGEDRELYSRPNGAVGTIVLTFVSTKQEIPCIFSAVVNIKCSLEEQSKSRKAVLDGINFFIIKNYEIQKEDLLDGNIVLFGNDLYTNFERNSSIVREDIIFTQRKEDYLTLLYGNLWGINRTGIDKAKKAAKALANFIYARPVSDLNTFIRVEFLEEKKMDEEVSRLSDALITLKELKEESKIIEDGNKELKQFSTNIDNILSLWESNATDHYLFALHHLEIKNDLKESLLKKFEQNDKKIEQLEKNIESDIKKKEKVTKQLNPLLSKRDHNESYQKIELIEDEIKLQVETIGEIKKELRQLSHKMTTNFWSSIKTLLDEDFEINDSLELQEISNHLETFSKMNINELLPYQYSVSDTINSEGFEKSFLNPLLQLNTIEPLFKSFIQSEDYRKKQNSSSHNIKELETKEKDIIKHISELTSKIQKIENHKIFCPTEVMEQFEILQSSLPTITVSMVYQHVDFKDDEKNWAESIEGFLKNNRFAIIVPVGHEVVAINIVKANKLNYLKIIQSEKMLNDVTIIGKSSIKENSIVNKLIIDNEITKAYLIKNYRNVLCYENELQLKSAERGITKDHKAVNGGLMFYCKARELFFGESALQSMLDGFKNDLLIEKNRLIAVREKLPMSRIINKILLSDFPNIHINASNLINNFAENYTGYKNNIKIIQSLNTVDFKELNNSILELESQIKGIEESIIDNKVDLKNLNILKKGRNQELENIENDLKRVTETLNSNKENLIKITNLMHSSYDIEKIVSTENITQEPKHVKDIILDDWNKLINNYNKSKIFEQKEIYYIENPEILVYNFSFDGFVSLFAENIKIKNEFTRLENTLQMKFKKEIEDGEKKVKEVFIDGFCVTMYRNIKTSRQEIDQFSTMLSRHKFEDDQFILVTKDADPEYEEYRNLFQAIAENKDLFAIANGKELALTKERLLEKFLTIGKNKNELLRISDYRNYAKYDIIQKDGMREVSLSKSGKNSGGQGETSYYIIRSINLHSALNPMIAKKSTLETILIDESFVKTNDDRAKEIINYLNQTLGFQVIMALPTKGANELLKMDCSNYNIAKLPPKNKHNGELNYETWSKYTNNNAEAINRLIQSELPSLFNLAEIEGRKEYELLNIN
ncbi:MAG: SbcC/MukB-like Walker B domain-containing protein [Candidatus Marinarcus sp.]|uniref:SbcC/MukB-like Walker B domain-containing protein n=1 Tax=Candidatus Marinarcus sp. TaxID=3100987 RepID=UPI003AFF7ABE